MRSLLLLATILAMPAIAGTTAEAFNQGSTFGRGALSGAHGRIAQEATTAVPQYSPTPPQRSLFGAPGLGPATQARTQACITPGNTDPACAAIGFSRDNPTRRGSFTFGANDPVLSRSRTITADPQSVAGSLAGTYSACEVKSVTVPEIFETRMCHATRGLETQTCQRILIVTPESVAGCTPGQFLTRVTADPCPLCPDYVAFDFSCGSNDYVLHVSTQWRYENTPYRDLGTLHVPGYPGLEVPRTAGPSHVDGITCYQTFFTQSCGSTSCTIRAAFANPCQGTHVEGQASFIVPTTTRFTDSWDDRCTMLEARTR